VFCKGCILWEHKKYPEAFLLQRRLYGVLVRMSSRLVAFVSIGTDKRSASSLCAVIFASIGADEHSAGDFGWY
jgi:hypothetical protein